MEQISRRGMTSGIAAKALAGAAALALLGAAPSAEAAVITWILQDVVFDDGGAAYGSFDYDTDLQTADNFDITTTAGRPVPGFHYDAATSHFSGANLYAYSSLSWCTTGCEIFLDLKFEDALDAPGTVALVTGNYGAASSERDVRFRSLTSGSVVGQAAVPEPAGWALMLAGFGGLGATLRRRRAMLAGA
jgi:hypothetical protein